MREQTRRFGLSPTAEQSDDQGFFDKPAIKNELAKEVATETESDYDSELNDESASDNDYSKKLTLKKKSTYRPESKVIDYDDINL